MPNSKPNHTQSETISSIFHLCLILVSLHFLPTSATLRFDTESIFLLAGQSNMAGRGGVINNRWDRVVPPQSYPNPSIFRLNAKLRWVEAKEPLHIDIDSNHTCGLGPGMSFANTLLANEPGLGPIGLVPCAVGGTGISDWARGGLLYRRLVRRARAALRDGGTIQALIWYQGERDTLFREGALDYQRRLEKFFSDLRADLQSPMLPIIQVGIASGEGAYIETVRQAQLAIDLLNLKTIDAMGLPLEPDHLHLTTSAQVTLGEKLAYAFLQFLPKQAQAVLPSQVGIASEEGAYIETVRQAQLAIDLLNLKTIDAMGLPLEPDHLHLTTSTQVTLGEKLAYAFLQFLPKQAQAVLPSQVQINSGSVLLINLCFTCSVVFSLITALLKRL